MFQFSIVATQPGDPGGQKTVNCPPLPVQNLISGTNPIKITPIPILSNTTTSKESILTARSYARNVPGLEHGLSKQAKGMISLD